LNVLLQEEIKMRIGVPKRKTREMSIAAA